jgi:hypothetical protein
MTGGDEALATGMDTRRVGVAIGVIVEPEPAP